MDLSDGHRPRYPWRIRHLKPHENFHLIEGDLSDQPSLNRAVRESEPDEVYNLAAQSFVGTSFDQPVYTGDVTGLGATRVLEAVRQHAPDSRFYQASTSEMFGEVAEMPQDEETEFNPRSPYGVAKLYGHWATINYREAHDIYAGAGSCSTTRARAAARTSSPGRSHEARRLSPPGSRTNSASAISTRSATGGTPATT
jgi:GDP-mannose 4,6-dehydratase